MVLRSSGAHARGVASTGQPGRAEEHRCSRAPALMPRDPEAFSSDRKTFLVVRVDTQSREEKKHEKKNVIPPQRALDARVSPATSSLGRGAVRWARRRRRRVAVAEKKGGLGESNPRPRPPEGRIMPLDQIPNLGLSGSKEPE